MSAHSPHHVALGRAIGHFREKNLGISQEALADRIGISRTYVRFIERGERNVTFSVIVRLCEGLGVEPEELFAEYKRQRDQLEGD